SLPNFVADIGQVFGAYVNEQSDAYASGYPHRYNFVSNEGGKEAQQAVLGQFHMGSDHDVYNEGSFRIPCIYMHDWPDRYIHTNFDLPANIDPTKLKRAAFIGGASGYFLANIQSKDVPVIWSMIRQQALVRTGEVIQHSNQIPQDEIDNLFTNHFKYERGVFNSLKTFAPVSATVAKEADAFYANLELTTGKSKASEPKTKSTSVVYKRNPAVKGPLSVFGYDYLFDHYGEKAAAIRLMNYQGLWGHEYAYETLNFVDGTRTVLDIRNAVSAEFGPIPLDVIEEYLKALESIQVIIK
ncbi:MAG TPA: hypothetical protein VG737_02675, partial [Cyclobacteriaceae bacterium]|nr:hypothetical protein [Cyclobacteriaceae bacterium]